jgi:hypothetical protein
MESRRVSDARRQSATGTGNTGEMQKRAGRQPQLPVSADPIRRRPEKTRDKQQHGRQSGAHQISNPILIGEFQPPILKVLRVVSH